MPRASICSATLIGLLCAIYFPVANAIDIDVDVTAGLDRDTRELFRSLVPDAVKEVRTFIEQMRPELKQDMQEYSEIVRLEIYQVMSRAHCMTEATVHHLGRDIFGRYNAVVDMDSAYSRIFHSINGASTPTQVDSAYVAFISTAQVDLCDVQGAPQPERYIGGFIRDAELSDKIWLTLRRVKCERFDACFDALAADTSLMIRQTDKVILAQTDAEAAMSRISAPKVGIGGRLYGSITGTFDVTPYEHSYGQLASIQQAIVDARNGRKAEGLDALNRAEKILSHSVPKLLAAINTFRADAGNCSNQAASIQNDHSLQTLADETLANAAQVDELVATTRGASTDLRGGAEDLQNTSNAIRQSMLDWNVKAKAAIASMEARRKQCDEWMNHDDAKLGNPDHGP